jgi:hypothetical protein
MHTIFKLAALRWRELPDDPMDQRDVGQPR